MVLDSGTPFNITTGQDLNGDNQFNDRPAFATDRSTNIVKTKYGSFTLLPSAFERIPYNLGNGPRQFSTFEDQQVVRARTRIERRGGNGMLRDRRVVVARGVDRQGGMGAGLGPGGLNGRGGGPPALDKQVQRRYSLKLAAMGENIFNNVNLSPPGRRLGIAALRKIHCPGGRLLLEHFFRIAALIFSSRDGPGRPTGLRPAQG